MGAASGRASMRWAVARSAAGSRWAMPRLNRCGSPLRGPERHGPVQAAQRAQQPTGAAVGQPPVQVIGPAAGVESLAGLQRAHAAGDHDDCQPIPQGGPAGQRERRSQGMGQHGEPAQAQVIGECTLSAGPVRKTGGPRHRAQPVTRPVHADHSHPSRGQGSRGEHPPRHHPRTGRAVEGETRYPFRIPESGEPQ
jgi:hypothetical protein